MVVGIFPVVGMPLPFISQGGTALVVNMITIGIILSLRRTT
jgi:cell division protein FtsW (lipid II flippase)|tara:strand:- start:13 stop:135 length:123 start_codon:yes stop_codon:yes gene_type:complete